MEILKDINQKCSVFSLIVIGTHIQQHSLIAAMALYASASFLIDFLYKKNRIRNIINKG